MLEVVVDDLGVLAALDDVLLHGGIDLALAHGDADTAHQIDHLDIGVRVLHADLVAFQVLRLGDGLVGVDVPRTRGVQGGDFEIEFVGGGEQWVEHAFAGGRLHLFQIVVEVRGRDDGKIAVVALGDRHGHNGQLQSAGADHLGHGALVAQNGVGVDLYLIAAIGGSGEFLTEISQCDVFGVCFRLVEGHPDDGRFFAVFSGAAAAGQAPGGSRKGCRAQDLEKGAAVDLLFHG